MVNHYILNGSHVESSEDGRGEAVSVDAVVLSRPKRWC